MYLSVRELELRKLQLPQTIPPGQIEFFDTKLRQAGPIELSGTAELLDQTDEIRVHGHLRVVMEGDCDRCLEPARFLIDSDFDLFYSPAVESSPGEEREIHEVDTDIGTYQGDGIELGDVLREFILLTLPMQRVCRENCLGICPICGQNRNNAACDCRVETADDRWSALRNI